MFAMLAGYKKNTTVPTPSFGSSVMATTGLQFFRVPPVDFRFEARRYVHYRPVYQGIEPITFHVPATDDYMDIKGAKVIVKVRLKTSGAATPASKSPAPEKFPMAPRPTIAPSSTILPTP